ncbi:TRAP transporter small permease [Falsirhodobacter sp. 1013]|uniref:TRAP transporter small permease n=1 Tax=Falsirhodobacter sp. 1013 TaxID=3417566 RepID=UPI003EB82D14
MLSFVALAGLILADVITRNLGIGFAWALEGSEYLMMVGGFIGAPWVLRRGGHVAIDVVVQMLGAMPRARLARGADAMGLAICLPLTAIAVDALLSARASGSLVFKTLIFPEWWLMIPVALCFAILSVEFLLRTLSAREAVA